MISNPQSMNYYIIPAAFLVTLFIVLFFSMFSKRSMRSLWVFIFIIFLATWAGQLWITPFGPIGWGIAWVPLFMVALFFSFLIFALMPAVPVTKNEEKQAEEDATIAFGILFWIVFILLILSIVAGYYRTTNVIT